MIPTHIFENYIWKGHYPGNLMSLQSKAHNHFVNNKKLNSILERGGGLSSSTDTDAPQAWEEAQDFLEWIKKPIITIWQDWAYQNTNARIVSSWVNLHPPGAWTDEHSHGSIPLVVVLYIDQPLNGGNLEIQNPLFYHWQGYNQLSTTRWKEIPVSTGDVVIFPGWINHRTQQNLSNQNRIVASFNIFS
jgi:uncharacterized protein (TIGR02466 family)